MGNKRKKGCAGFYNKEILLRTIPIPVGKLGIHKLAIVRSSLIPELYRANYGSILLNGNIIRFKWAINCLNYKLPIFSFGRPNGRIFWRMFNNVTSKGKLERRCCVSVVLLLYSE